MSTKIKDPTTSQSISGRGSGIITGAASGAAAGTIIMPGVGTAVGAAVGAVVGFLGGASDDKANYHRKLASKYDKLRKERQSAIVRRDMIRDFRMQRAAAMTMIGNEQGGTRSSAPKGAIDSMGAQFGFNSAFFDADVYLMRKYQKHMNKAGRHQAAANVTMSTLGAVTGAVQSMAGSFSFGSPSPSGGGVWAPTGGGSPGAPYSAGWDGSRASIGSSTYNSPFSPPSR